MLRRVSLNRILPPAVLLILVWAFFYLPAHFDPEPYHDGSQFPAALGVSNGLVVHSEVFSAYGFMTAWLQGIAVEVLGPTLLSIRIFTVVAILVAALLLYQLFSIVLRRPWVSLLATSAWIVMWPGISVSWGTPLLPWPSLVYLDFQLACVILILTSYRRTRLRRTALFLAGAFASMALLTRINYGFFFCVGMAITLLALRRRMSLSGIQFGVIALGFLTPILVSGLALLKTDSLNEFLQQSILGPLGGAVKTSHTDFEFLLNAYIRGSLPILMALLILWVIGQRWMWSPWKYQSLVAIAVAALTVIATTGVAETPLRQEVLKLLTWAPGLDTQAMQVCFVFVILTVAGTLFSFAFLIAKKWIIRSRKSVSLDTPSSGDTVVFFLLLTAALTSLSQIYPVADPNHLWWAVPLPMVFVCFGLCHRASSRTSTAMICVLFLPALFVAPIATWRYYEVPRTEIKTGSLSGMYVKTAYLSDYLKVDALLSTLKPASTKFLCQGGLFTTWTGVNLASDPAYVDYAYGVDEARIDTKPDSVIFCEEDGAEGSALEYARSHGLRVTSQTGRVELSYFARVNMLKLER